MLTEQEFYLRQSASSNASPPSTAASNFYDEPPQQKTVLKQNFISNPYSQPEEKVSSIVEDDFVDVALEQQKIKSEEKLIK